MGGATLEEHPAEGQPMKINGSAMLVQASSREEALKVVEGDVYTKSGVWDTSKVGLLERSEGLGDDAPVMARLKHWLLTADTDASAAFQVGSEAGVVSLRMFARVVL